MITKDFSAQIEDYLAAVYSPTEEDFKYLEKADGLILETATNMNEAIRRGDDLLYAADELMEYMAEMFNNDGGISPRLLQFEERYLQLLVTYAKANNHEAMYLDSLALLCFVESFDLYYLREFKKKGLNTF